MLFDLATGAIAYRRQGQVVNLNEPGASPECPAVQRLEPVGGILWVGGSALRHPLQARYHPVGARGSSRAAERPHRGMGHACGAGTRFGCGTGSDAVYLAEQGWTVTAVDGVGQALSKARARAQSRGVEVNWVQGDACRLEQLGIGDVFDLMLDRGCFHDFTDDQRDRYARAVSAVANPGAVLLMFAFQPRRRGLGPRGVTGEELMRHLGQDWELLSSTQDTEVRLPRWLGEIRDRKST